MSQKRSGPHAEDKVKLSDDEIEEALLAPPTVVHLYITRFGVLWAFRCTNRRFEFKKRRQQFIRVHNETLSVAAMCVCNPDRSPSGMIPLPKFRMIRYNSPLAVYANTVALNCGTIGGRV